MKALKLNAIIEKDGELTLSGVPYKKGEEVELFILRKPSLKKNSADITDLMPKHKLGSKEEHFRREEIYNNGR